MVAPQRPLTQEEIQKRQEAERQAREERPKPWPPVQTPAPEAAGKEQE